MDRKKIIGRFIYVVMLRIGNYFKNINEYGIFEKDFAARRLTLIYGTVYVLDD
jgi:hypothetical protein